MVSLDVVRISNAQLKKLRPGLVAVFVGGTSGIGESTAREFVRNTLKPKVYLVGRNQTQANSLIDEFKKINDEAHLKFIQSDVALLKNVDEACEQIRKDESKINLLFLSAGILTTKGRDETNEGLDKKFSLHYYARMRFVHNLLPLLRAASGKGELSRSVSVLAGGHEAKLITSDLELKSNYTLGNCASHATTMNSLAAETLANENPGTTFVHAAPGFVMTNIAREFPAIVRFFMPLIALLLKPWEIPLKESGERHLFAATSETFPPRSADRSGEDVATGSDGVKGSGAYLLNQYGEPAGNDKVLRAYREDGTREVVWRHTEEVFEKMCGAETS